MIADEVEISVRLAAPARHTPDDEGARGINPAQPGQIDDDISRCCGFLDTAQGTIAGADRLDSPVAKQLNDRLGTILAQDDPGRINSF
jgi:hypothetical protein